MQDLPVRDYDEMEVGEAYFPFKIRGVQYRVKEPSGEAVRVWRNAILKRAKVSGGGTVTEVGEIADTESILVAGCTYSVGKDGEFSKAVPLDDVRRWPNRVLTELFAEAKRMGELEEKEDKGALLRRLGETQAKLDALELEPAAKNGHGASPAG